MFGISDSCDGDFPNLGNFTIFLEGVSSLTIEISTIDSSLVGSCLIFSLFWTAFLRLFNDIALSLILSLTDLNSSS